MTIFLLLVLIIVLLSLPREIAKQIERKRQEAEQEARWEARAAEIERRAQGYRDMYLSQGKSAEEADKDAHTYAVLDYEESHPGEWRR